MVAPAILLFLLPGGLSLKCLCRLPKTNRCSKNPSNCKLTVEEKCRGTWGYMAPEFCRMRVFDRDALISPAADVFSLGIVVLETFLGHLPYDSIPFPPKLLEAVLPRGMPWGLSRNQALEQVKMDLIDDTLARLGTSIPEPGKNKVWNCFQTGNLIVDRLVVMCCHPDPQQRASAAEVAAFLAHKMRQLESTVHVAPQQQLRAAAPGEQSAGAAPSPAQLSGCGKVKRLLKKLLPFSKRRAQQSQQSYLPM